MLYIEDYNYLILERKYRIMLQWWDTNVDNKVIVFKG
jgi:hypothetical protein